PDLFCAHSWPAADPMGRAVIVWNAGGGLDFAHPGALVASTVVEGIMAAAPWDLDEDGLLDVVVSPFGKPEQVFRNLGGRQFEEVAAGWGLDAPGSTWATALFDFDGDGRADPYVMNDGFGKDNYAFRAMGPGPGGEPRFERFHPLAPECDFDGLFGNGYS